MKQRVDRRAVLRNAAGAAGVAITGSLLAGRALADMVHPHESSLKALDKNNYVDRFRVHGTFDFHGGKTQMMALGERRFLFVKRTVIEVTNPLKPKVIKHDAYEGGQDQVAYNAKAGKWVLITSSSPPITFRRPDAPLGKYQDPTIIPRNMAAPGHRGIRIYDVSDPFDIKLLSMWSCDGGDPRRRFQTGGGCHRNTYDGGKYIFLSAAPDNSFIHQESPEYVYSWAVQILDIEDPSNPKFVSNWWFPGQRAGEEEAYRLWRESGDRLSFTGSHGPLYTPQRIEDGGRYCHIAYSSMGYVTLDVSNPAKPELVSRWRPPYAPGNIPVHTVYPAWLDRGLMMTTAEPLNADCYEPFVDNYLLDVSDIRNPKKISSFGNWDPPRGAPYKDFCDARGRKGTHNPPHMKAPGKAHPTWCCFSAFNAGLQAVDFSDPAKPVGDGYYLPANPGDITKPSTYIRHGESVFVEWDRRIMWFGSGVGMTLLSHPALGDPILEPMPVREWALPSANQGMPA